jgi:hypothetical protein
MAQTKYADVVDASLNATWQSFLTQKVNTFIKWDLVRFFYDNPHTVDTAENIAQFVGRDARATQQALAGLQQAAVLDAKQVNSLIIYQLTVDTEMRQLVNEFVAACHNREFRVEAINHVARHMGAAKRAKR